MTMFTRILKKAQVKAILDILKKEFSAVPKAGDALHRVYAPDGDLVFTAAEVKPGVFACRFHPDVFSDAPLDQSKANSL
jgi:hypothetical protein